MKNVVAVVDGLNLFHALRSQSVNETNLDIVAFLNRQINLKTEQLTTVSYFSAPVTHISKKARLAQREYLENLHESGVLITLGNFKRKQVHCSKCGGLSDKYEEKETDVNLALAIAFTARQHLADKIVIFSADTDLLPAIKMAKLLGPQIEIRIASTAEYLRNVPELRKATDGKLVLTADLVSAHLFVTAGPVGE